MNEKILDELDEIVEWDYVETEGPDVIRYDWGQYSMWLYLKTNTTEGYAPRKVIDLLKKEKVDVKHLKEI